MLCLLPDEIVSIIAENHSNTNFLEKHITKDIAKMIRLLSNLCICSTMYIYYIKKLSQHIPEIKNKIVEDIYSKLLLMDTMSGEMYHDDVCNISIYFNNITHGFTYVDFNNIPINKEIYLSYWYCCLTIFSTKEVIDDFLASEPDDATLVNGLFFSIVGLNLKKLDYSYPYGTDFSNNYYRRSLFCSVFYDLEIKPHVKQIISTDEYSSNESESEEDVQYIHGPDRTHAIIMLIDKAPTSTYFKIFDFICELAKIKENYLSNYTEDSFGEAMNVMIYLFRLTQKKQIDFTMSLNDLLDDLARHKQIMSLFKKQKRFNLLVSAVHFNDITMLKTFFLSENKVIDPIIKIKKPYNNTQKSKRPRWMRFDREFPDLRRNEKNHRRDISERCDQKNHNRSSVNESTVIVKELLMYEEEESNIC
jgi:hypothetical protein